MEVDHVSKKSRAFLYLRVERKNTLYGFRICGDHMIFSIYDPEITNSRSLVFLHKIFYY